jgi:diguanylate cyclase (GGDEF)-like protein/PAS domain S-box-containing protein
LPQTRPTADLGAELAAVAAKAQEPGAAVPGQRGACMHSCLRLDELPLPSLLLDQAGRLLQASEQAWTLLDGSAAVRSDPWCLLKSLSRHDRARLRAVLEQATAAACGRLDSLQLYAQSQPAHRVDAFWSRFESGSGARPFLLQLLDRSADFLSGRDQRLMHSLLDSSHDDIYAFDLEGRCIYANQKALESSGQAREHVIGLSLDKILPLHDAIVHYQENRQVISSGQPAAFHHLLQLGGRQRQMRVHKYPLLDTDQRIWGVGCVSHDVTAERLARRDQQLSEAVFVNSNDAIVVADARGYLLRANPAFERLSGYAAQALPGRFAELLRQDAAPELELEAPMLEGLRLQGRWTGEALLHTAAGTELAVRLSVTEIADPGCREPGYMAVISDLTEARRASDEILRLATTDSLTGLPNRALFQDRLRQAVSLARREQQSFALLFADLDHFKEVNDTLGHSVGDELLIVIAQRLCDAVRDMDTVARLGGDEFVVLLPSISRDHASELAARLLHQLHEPMALDGAPDYRAQASVGLVMFPDDGDSADALLRHADQAMYAAKRAGRNQLQAYSAELDEELRDTYILHQELRLALERQQFEVYWQPKFRLQDMELVGVEALVRWRHPRLGLLASSDFLQLAIQQRLLGAIDQWMLQTSLRQIADWARQGRWPDHWRLALNQSASDLQRPDWLDLFRKLLAGLDLEPRWLAIELTEAIWARPEPELLARLQQFRDLGVALLIDDFGTGYSSLSCLSQLPVSGIKIDQCFVRGMEHNEADRVLVEIICTLVRRLGLELLAEGIETEAQRQQLLQLGCQLGQGFLLSGPLPPQEFKQRFLPLPAAGPA